MVGWQFLFSQGHMKFATKPQDPNVTEPLCFFLGATIIFGEYLMTAWIDLMQTYISLLLWCVLADLETIVSSYAGKRFLPHD